jgi:predicted phage terminase large subunit-like protein
LDSTSLPMDSPQMSSEDLLISLASADLPEEAWQQLYDLSLRSLAPSDVFAFGEYVFGYEAYAHHRELVAFEDSCIRDRKSGVILEPRGAAKTTWGNTIWLTHLIANNPDIRIGLFSNTAKQSNDFSRGMRSAIESTRFKEIYGECVSKSKWTDVEWIHAQSRWHKSKDVTLYSNGVGGATISKRFDLIFCDDILDEENTSSPEQREKVATWFWKTLIPCLVPGGVVIIVGTRWADEDLYDILMKPIDEGGNGWRHIVRKAIIEDEDGELSSYWPEHWPLDMLLEKRRELGTPLFNCAYQNDIRGLMEGNIFRGANFQYFTTLDPEKQYTIRMGIDLASSEKQSADFTARVVTAEDTDGNYYILSAYRDRRESRHAEFVYDGWAAYPSMGLVRCENQQFQSTLVQEIMRDYPKIPIEGIKADTDKVTRARAVAAKYEAHRVYHHQSLKGSDFEMELTGFPKGHDDFVDAEGYSMDLGGANFMFGKLRR